MTMITCRKKSPGLSLVELLVSTVILSLALVALSQLYMAAMATHKQAQALAIANSVAQEKYERVTYLGATAYDELFNQASYAGESSSVAVEGNVCTVTYATTGIDTNVLRNPSVKAVITKNPFSFSNGQDDLNLSRAVITVTWDGNRGKKQSVTLTTYLSKRPQV